MPYKPQYLSGVFRGNNSENSENVMKALVKIQEGDIIIIMSEILHSNCSWPLCIVLLCCVYFCYLVCVVLRGMCILLSYIV